MRKSYAQLRERNDSGLPGMKASLNLSTERFHDAGLIRLAGETVRAAGTPASRRSR